MPPTPNPTVEFIVHSAELILWAIATFLACWSLAVFFRLLDERRFFKKHPSSSAPRCGARWAGVAGLAGFACSALTLLIAIWFAKAIPSGRDSATGVFHVVGGASGVFAFVIWFLWGLGDRSRGRRRCSRCWYDMSEVPGRQCPECGREPRDEQGLFQSRRARWMAVTAIVLTAGSGVMLMGAAKSKGPGLLNSTPTWMLVKGWRVLPNSWMAGEDGSLADRFEGMNVDPVSIAHGEELVSILARNSAARKREELWRAAESVFSGTWNPGGSSDPEIEDMVFSYPRKTDLNQLAAQVISDRIERLSAFIDNPNHDENLTGHFTSRTIEMWISSRLIEQGQVHPSDGWPFWRWRSMPAEKSVRAEILSKAITDLPPNFDSLLDHPQPDVRSEYLGLMATLGNYDTLLEGLQQHTDGEPHSFHRMIRTDLMTSLGCADPKDRTAFFETMSNWIRNGTGSQAQFAIDFSTLYARQHRYSMDPPSTESFLLRDTLVATVRNSMDSRQTPYGKSIRARAVNALLIRADDPSIIFPVLKSWVLENTDESELELYHYQDFSGSSIAWLENFAQLAEHDDPLVRLLCARTAPTDPDSLDERRIDDILLQLKQDHDYEVMTAAQDRALDRREQRIGLGIPDPFAAAETE